MTNLRARLSAGPAEGWISLFLVAILAVSVALSLDDAGLVLGRREWTDFLAWAALGGVAVGFLGARVRWNRPLAHLIGAAFAALIVPLLAGGVLLPNGSPAARFEEVARASTQAVLDLALRGLPVTRESGHYLLVLGCLCWANGMFAASAVFRHGRPIGPIIVLGTVLVANAAATTREQIWFLMLFTMAALFLLTRLHALEERATWVRRRIGDPATVGSLYLRGGTVFILATTFAAFALTATAHSAPLAGMWDDLRPALVDISQWLQRIIPAAPDSRSLGVPSFGQQVTIGGIWSTSNDPALVIERTPGDDRKLYWRATVYDAFKLRSWEASSLTNAQREAGVSILDGTLDAIPATSARTPQTFKITPQSPLFKVVFSPIDPLSVDRPVTINLSGRDGYLQSLNIQPGVPYSVTAAIQTIADIDGGLTHNRLRAAGQNYPASIRSRYLQIPPGTFGPAADLLYAGLAARAKSADKDNPFDFATSIVSEFQNSGRYVYDTNVLGVCDDDSSIVECFAADRMGYCEFYASTMVMLLRKHGIPARLVEGFLPGSLNVTTGRETISTGAAHAWVEVYFPAYGWHMFDPTGGGLAQPPVLVEGTQVPLVTPGPSPSFGRSSGDPRDGADGPSRGTTTTPPGPRGPGDSSGPAIIIAIVLLAVVILLGFLTWRRGPRGPTTPEGVYASVTGIARRLGFGPRPTQTTFEYATALGDILPGVRPELQTVAAAKVEVAYGKRQLGDERIRAVRDSYRRLRVGLLRLALRRRDRRRLR